MKKFTAIAIVSWLLIFFIPIAVAQTPLPTPTPIEYTLPYPGILPDHPLYFFKEIRDAILEILITDPIRKGELYILLADKRLVMSQVLVDANKEMEAMSSLARAGEYEAKAFLAFSSIKSRGSTIPPYITENFALSLRKHIEELTILVGKVDEIQKEVVSSFISKDTELLGKAGELQ